MVLSGVKALDYDNIKKIYLKHKKINSLRSNDALYDKSNKYEFIEKGDYF